MKVSHLMPNSGYSQHSDLHSSGLMTPIPSYNFAFFVNRKRAKRSKKETKFLKTKEFIPQNEFEERSNQLMNTLYNAFKDLETINDNLVVTLESNELKVEVKKKGEFSLTLDTPQREVIYTSPVGGFFTYFYEKDNEWWISPEDNHILQEQIMREFGPLVKGYIKL
mmetsp:Transcript_10789/g.11791  ORF Transcript_10789/g.11791 Transcript_10789/m.11791 type:complete len:166 (+) Transcript_10789:2-499(+)